MPDFLLSSVLGTKAILGSIIMYLRLFKRAYNLKKIDKKVLFGWIPVEHKLRKKYFKGFDVDIGMKNSSIVVDFGSFDQINTAKVHFWPELNLFKDAAFGLYVHFDYHQLIVFPEDIVDKKIAIFVT